jgi:hypothetical protein
LRKTKEGSGKWSDLQLVNVVVSLIPIKAELLFTPVIQLFEIVEYQPTEENDTDVVYLTCKDNNGDDCTLS